MAKIAYIEKNFSGSSLLVIAQANEIIEEYQADGLDLTLRQLYYQFVTTGEDNMARLGFPEAPLPSAPVPGFL